MRGYRYVIILILATLSLHHIDAQQKYQMRAAWIATVANIDWPSRSDLPVEEQKREMEAMLDSLHALNINAVIFQIRPTADAFYYSDFEPWSRYLTGRQGVEPEPFYDPLAFVVHEAHNRCMEVHVWLNPYRTLNVDNVKLLHDDHLFFRRPDLFVKYGNQYYFDPGLDATREYLNDVVADVVNRYDIDAVHFDDYFYPYRIAGKEFPDDKTFKENPRGFKDKGEWRRNNVNMVIRELQQTIKSRKPWVEFGISPFGVWRNASQDERGSDTEAGQTNYDDLYADVLKWMENGDIDYVVPQLYWEIGKKVADYAVLIDWWSRNAYNCNLYIGMSASNIGVNRAAAWQTPNELCRQLKMNMDYPRVDGTAFYSSRPFLKNPQGICDSLSSNYFKYPALIPISKSIGGKPSASPSNLRIERFGERDYLMWDEVYEAGGNAVAYYVVYTFPNGEEIDTNNPANILCLTRDNCLDLSEMNVNKSSTIIVTSVNRYNFESGTESQIYYKETN